MPFFSALGRNIRRQVGRHLKGSLVMATWRKVANGNLKRRYIFWSRHLWTWPVLTLWGPSIRSRVDSQIVRAESSTHMGRLAQIVHWSDSSCSCLRFRFSTAGITCKECCLRATLNSLFATDKSRSPSAQEAGKSLIQILDIGTGGLHIRGSKVCCGISLFGRLSRHVFMTNVSEKAWQAHDINEH
jgi:hypothetical protein